MRGCESKYYITTARTVHARHPLWEDVSRNKYILYCHPYADMSSSVRGCESKDFVASFSSFVHVCHPLWEDVSRNATSLMLLLGADGHPLWEDVSRNEYGGIPDVDYFGHPLWEDVSRNRWQTLVTYVVIGHPLWEDVSRNISLGAKKYCVVQSSSVRGCESKL